MPDFTRRNFDDGGDASLSDIAQTDQLLDALATERPVYSDDASESELAYLLAGWRDEVRHAPLTAAVTPRDAALALDRATAPAAPPRRRLGLAVAGSVAAAVLGIGGFASVVYDAGPGDALYNLRTMFFGEQQATRDDQVALAAQSQLAEVQQLIDRGDWTAAQDRLQTITTTVAAVGDEERQQELVDQWQELSVKVETRDINATVPADAPPVVLPEVPSDLPLPVLLSPDAVTATTSPLTSPVTSIPDSAIPTPTATTPLPTPTTPLPTPSSPVPPSAPAPTSAPPSPTPAPTSPVPVTTTTQAPAAAPRPSVAPVTPSAPVTLNTSSVVATPPPVPTTTLAAPPPVPTVSVVPPASVAVSAPTAEAPATQAPDIVVTTTTVVGLPE